jgi:endogenous inhibitor of DNA gyrase (YacG/DUF329 family)
VYIQCFFSLLARITHVDLLDAIHRILKEGGRVAISDVLTKGPMSEELRCSAAALVGCVAGASGKEEYEMWLCDAGFGGVVVRDKEVDLNVWMGGEVTCCGGEESGEEGYCESRDGGVAADMKGELTNVDLNAWAGELFCLMRRGD